MLKLLHVAREEIEYHLRQWTFYLTAVGMPLIFAAIGALPQLRAVSQQTPLASVETIFTETEVVTVPTGYVDHAGLITVVPKEQAEKLREFADETTATAALQRGEIESYYVIAADYVQSGSVTQYSTNPQLLSGADDVVKKLLQDNLLRSLGDATLAARLNQPIKLVRRGPPPAMFSFIPAGTDLRQVASAGLVLALFAYLLNLGGSLLLRALQREVRARVLEVLIASTTPEQFIGGKLLGLSALTLAQGGVTLLAGAFVYGRNPSSFGPAALPLPALMLSLPYLLLGYLAYCGAMMGVAAIWPNLPESATLLAMVRLLALSPVIGVLFILPNADGPISVVLTLLPLSAPLLMPFRLLLGPVPWWQWAAGLAALAAWTALWVWISMRLFRAQSLLTGRSATPATMWAILRG